MRATLHFDGSALPTNPGHAIGGAVLRLEDGKEERLSLYIGEGSNNSGEYAGLILGLRRALELGTTHIEVFGDSDLVVKQVSNVWRSNKAHLTIARDWTQALLDRFEDWTISWVPREQNTEADALTRFDYLPEHIRRQLQSTKKVGSKKSVGDFNRTALSVV